MVASTRSAKPCVFCAAAEENERERAVHRLTWLPTVCCLPRSTRWFRVSSARSLRPNRSRGRAEIARRWRDSSGRGAPRRSRRKRRGQQTAREDPECTRADSDQRSIQTLSRYLSNSPVFLLFLTPFFNSFFPLLFWLFFFGIPIISNFTAPSVFKFLYEILFFFLLNSLFNSFFELLFNSSFFKSFSYL